MHTMHFSLGSALGVTTGASIVAGTDPGIVAGTGTGTGTDTVAGTGTGTGIVAGSEFGFGCASAMLARAARREVRRRMMLIRIVRLNGETTMLKRM